MPLLDLPGHTEESPKQWNTDLDLSEQSQAALDYFDSIVIEDNCAAIKSEDFGRQTRGTRPVHFEFTKEGEPYKVTVYIHYQNTFNKAEKRREYKLDGV